MNRLFDIETGHDFFYYRNSTQVVYFQINDGPLLMHLKPVKQFVRRYTRSGLDSVDGLLYATVQ